MILNHQHRFIFVHVPKAAGTTITRTLSQLTTFRDIEIGGTRYGEAIQERFAARFDLRKHSTAAALREKCPDYVWRRFFVFAFVRNPYARAYSLYRFLQKWKDGPHHGEIAALSFEEFLRCTGVQDGQIEIARPQVHWLQQEGKLVPGIDFVGRVEQFAEDFSFVQSMIRRRRIMCEDGRRDNASADLDEWRTAMTPAASELIEDIYAEDFDAFDYARQDAERPAA